MYSQPSQKKNIHNFLQKEWKQQFFGILPDTARRRKYSSVTFDGEDAYLSEDNIEMYENPT